MDPNRQQGLFGDAPNVSRTALYFYDVVYVRAFISTTRTDTVAQDLAALDESDQ